MYSQSSPWQRVGYTAPEGDQSIAASLVANSISISLEAPSVYLIGLAYSLFAPCMALTKCPFPKLAPTRLVYIRRSPRG